MSIFNRLRRRGIHFLIAVAAVWGVLIAAGALLRPWPLISKQYMGRIAPIGHLIEFLFDYPGARAGATLQVVELPPDVRIITLLPVIVQAVIVLGLTILAVRLLLGITREKEARRSAHRNLGNLSKVAIAGGLVQFGTGIWAWRTALAWLDLDPTAGPWEIRYQYLPTPDWPLALLLTGLITAAFAWTLRSVHQPNNEPAVST